MTEPHDKKPAGAMSETLAVRMSREHKDIIERAAALSGISQSDIMRVGGLAEAQRLLRALRDGEKEGQSDGQG